MGFLDEKDEEPMYLVHIEMIALYEEYKDLSMDDLRKLMEERNITCY